MRNKYGNKKSEYMGQTYASKLEANYAKELNLRAKAHDIKEWERQYKLPLVVNGVRIANYFVDFRVVTADGRVEFHETKGYWTSTSRLKHKLAVALYPEYTFVVIK